MPSGICSPAGPPPKKQTPQLPAWSSSRRGSPSSGNDPILQAAAEIQHFFDQPLWSHCIIGGVALLYWGEPRLTRDVDITLLAGYGREDEFILPVLDGPFRSRAERIGLCAKSKSS